MPFHHGSNYAYTKKKCRCDICRPWWNAYFKAYVEARCRRTGEAFATKRGGFVPGKPCACGCGLTLPEESPRAYKTGHKPSATGPVPAIDEVPPATGQEPVIGIVPPS